MQNYRIAASKKAGFSKFPETTDAFLEYAKAMKKNNTPGGMALGHASGDGNGWVYWCLWAHGGNAVDKDDKVDHQLAGDRQGARICQAAHDNMIPGVAAWNDAFNNKAFLAGELSWTNNGISIYVAAQEGSDQEGNRRGHGPCALAGRADRQADRIPSLLSRSW